MLLQIIQVGVALILVMPNRQLIPYIFLIHLKVMHSPKMPHEMMIHNQQYLEKVYTIYSADTLFAGILFHVRSSEL